MQLTKRGNTVAVLAFSALMLLIMGTVGAIETQDEPTCADYQASQDWQRAWESGCPFEDENGNYLYTWKIGQ